MSKEIHLTMDIPTTKFPQPIINSSRLALDTINQKPAQGIPSWLLHIMQHEIIERLAGTEPGSYKREPDKVYLQMQHRIGTCLLDQYLADNPLTMGNAGFEGTSPRTATTGEEAIYLDGILINSPEAVVTHLESFEFPRIKKAISEFNKAWRIHEIIQDEIKLQNKLGPDILKSGYGFVTFPILDYYKYGYTQYFSTYAHYPEVIEKHFSLQADLALLNNQAAAQAFSDAELPPLIRLDHDIADSHGTLVNPRSLDRLWFPHFARCLEPLLQSDIRMIWHCDGNLMEMVPRLLEAGLRGFQGFQYEDGMDYEQICQLNDREGRPLIIIAGVSVTRTLPFGNPQDVRKELNWLVNNGPQTGLFLGASSSIPPGAPWKNILTLVEGLKYFQTTGKEKT